MTPSKFREESAFAKIVNTEKGHALMVGGNVLHITGPEGVDWVDVVSRALRQGGQEQGILTGAIFATGQQAMANVRATN